MLTTQKWRRRPCPSRPARREARLPERLRALRKVPCEVPPNPRSLGENRLVVSSSTQHLQPTCSFGGVIHGTSLKRG
jgi:hypothetical protein